MPKSQQTTSQHIPEAVGLLLHSITSAVILLNAKGEILFGGDRPPFFSQVLNDLSPMVVTTASLPTKKIRETHWLDAVKTVVAENPDLGTLKIATDEGVITVSKLPDGIAEESLYLLEYYDILDEERLRLLQDVSQAVNSSLILEDIYESLGDVLIRYIPYKEAVILILDDTQNGIKVLVRIFEDGSLEIEGENNMFAGYDPLVDKVLVQPVAGRFDTETLPDSVVFTEGVNSAIMVPLINKGLVIGLIALSSSEADTYSSYHENLLSEISSQLAVAVENAKFYWQTQAQASREFLVNQLTKAIRQSLDIETMLNTATRELGQVLGVSRCYIQYHPDWENLGDEESVPNIYEHLLPGVKPLTEKSVDLEQSVFRLRQDQKSNPFVLNDSRQCPPQLNKDWLLDNEVKSLAVFPILIRDSFVGTMTLHQCDAYRSWVIEDIELLNAVAEHLGVALHQARLFETLDHQKQELEKTLEELQQAQLYLIQSEKMAVLGQFVAGIAHEVNTPLGTMMSNNATLESCFKKLKSGEEENPERLFGVVNDLISLNKMASERISDIVRNLRNFARLDESEMKRVNLHEGIESTLMVMKSSIPATVKIEKHYAEDLPLVDCFPGLLNQVFMNMVVNAVHALDENKKQENNTGKIVIASEYNQTEDLVTVSFSDNGKGIKPENLTRIFDPGFTTKGSGVGTGLGLALCYRIVEKHGGKIEVESAVGEGTTFTVFIPAKMKKSDEVTD